jgi:hypothetical protein
MNVILEVTADGIKLHKVEEALEGASLDNVSETLCRVDRDDDSYMTATALLDALGVNYKEVHNY